MSAGGPLTAFNMRQSPLQALIPHINGFPVNLGVMVITSTTVATVSAFQLVAGQGIHIQADAQVFIGDGFTAAIATTNAIAVSKRLDAWEPFIAFLNDVPPAGQTLTTVPGPGQLYYVYLAAVLQSAGSSNMYVANIR
jgi:hypothetical protein